MIYSIIMAGGIGSRFWPLSRSTMPKQLLSITGNESLLQSTIKRLSPLVSTDNHIIVATEQLKSVFPDSITQSVGNVLWEPIGKNTAPCIGWAAYMCFKKDPQAILVIVPADHWISSVDDFTDTLSNAIQEAQDHNTIVTIGIPAHSPHTGYGYIEVEPTDTLIKPVRSFTEKPNSDTAKHYLKKGNYYWNSGMFIVKAETLIKQFEQHLPKHHLLLQQLTHTQDSTEIHTIYNQFESISIDYGIMEQSAQITRLIPATFNWSDIGNWTSIEAFLEKDLQNNAIKGPAICLDSSGNIIYSPDKLVAVSDIHNMIIVNTDDALLILPKEHDQKIKDIYQRLDSQYK